MLRRKARRSKATSEAVAGYRGLLLAVEGMAVGVAHCPQLWLLALGMVLYEAAPCRPSWLHVRLRSSEPVGAAVSPGVG